MSIDGTKPWYPQDYPLEEVLNYATEKVSPWMLEDSKCIRDFRSDLAEDHHIRTHGPAGVFFDLRRHLENALHGQQIHQMPQRAHPQKRKRLDEEGRILVDAERFMGTVDEVITLAICKLEGTSCSDSRFVISDYAIPVLTDDIKKPLMEASRPCTDILDKYWNMVNSEKSDSPS